MYISLLTVIKDGLKLLEIVFKNIRKLKYLIRNYEKIYYPFNCLNKEAIFIDIGGNVGRVSQYVSDIYNPKIIEIYEPHLSLYNFLKEKFNKNKKVFVYNFAVSNINSEGLLFTKTNKTDDLTLLEGSSLEVKKKNIQRNNSQKVKLININNILEKYNYIDCIKIDIEGHEYKILDSLINNKKKIGKVICEFHGTDDDIIINKNYEFRESFLKYKNVILQLQKEEWLEMWV